jgi:hypothetical protein
MQPQAYQIVCLDKDKGLMRVVVAHCVSDDDAIRKAAIDVPDECAIVEVTMIMNERVVWRGTRAKLWRKRRPTISAWCQVQWLLPASLEGGLLRQSDAALAIRFHLHPPRFTAIHCASERNPIAVNGH